MSGNPLIGLVAATKLEAIPFIRDLGLLEQAADPFEFYRSDRLVLILTGIGKANAAMAVAHLIHRFNPALVCNVGASGATDARCGLGESYHIARIVEPDRPRIRSGLPREHLPDLLEGLPLAALATQDRPLRDPAERERIAAHAPLADMEGAAVAQTCRRFGVKCFLFKFVSDTADHRQSSDITDGIERYRDAHARFFRELALPRLLSLLTP